MLYLIGRQWLIKPNFKAPRQTNKVNMREKKEKRREARARAEERRNNGATDSAPADSNTQLEQHSEIRSMERQTVPSII